MENAKRLWLTRNTGASLAITCLCLVTLQACSTPYPDAEKKSTDNNSTATTTTTSTTTTTTTRGDAPADPKAPEKPGETQSNEDKKSSTDSSGNDKKALAENKTATPDVTAGQSDDPAKDPTALLRDLPQVTAASLKVDLRNMPDSDVILTVKGSPITVSDYKQEFKMREGKASTMLSSDPELEQRLIAEAAQRKLVLTDEEKKKLLETSKKAENSAPSIKNYLKESKITAKDFDVKVLQLGLALKTAAMMTRETLLNELVDQELLVLAAKDRDFYKKAFNKYIEAKRTPAYQQFLSQTGLTAEQAQKQVIDRTLIEMYVQLLKDQNSTVSEQEIQKIYDENKSKLKHGERFRLSQIVLAAPSDSKDQPGIKEQLKQKFPTLSDKDIEAKATEFKNQQKKQADEILARLQKGEKFEDLANRYTQDPGNSSVKNGGDIGWKEKDALEPDFVAKVSTLKVGQVYPHVLTTRFGYHILKLTEKEAPGVTSLADVKEGIRQSLVQEKQIKAVAGWLRTQHNSGVVKLSPQFLKLISANDKPKP